MTISLENLKFPIGNFECPEVISAANIATYISELEAFPGKLQSVVKDLTPAQLNFKYRPDGWSVKQVVHHCADSHMGCIQRFKLALTEDAPTIKPYPEHLFAELIDSQDDHLEDSLAIIKGVHRKLVQLCNNMSPNDFEKGYIHPEYQKTYKLNEATALYAWHSNHHLAHIENALESGGKYN